MFDTPDATTELVDFWNEILVPKFLKYRHIIVGGLTHHSAQVFPALPVEPGDAVLDVGCGFGDTAIELARRVGPAGRVVGIDCCKAFLDIGRADAAEAGAGNVTFVEGEAQSHPFTPEFDFCFSRFGTMFFANPVAGLRNMRRALRPGGHMTMIVWRSIEENPWLHLPKQLVLHYLPPPGEDARTCGPGPFSMADRDMVTAQLQAAGYEGISFTTIDAPVLVGVTPEEAVELQLTLGPAGEVVREAGELAERRHDEITAALRDELARYRTEEGVVMGSSSWMVTARNPG